MADTVDVWDLILLTIYITLGVLGAIAFRSVKSFDIRYRKYFVQGLIVKLLGGLAFALVYTYYYKYGGDTKAYWRDSWVMVQYFLEAPVESILVLFRGEEYLNVHHYDLDQKLKFAFGTSEFFTVKFSSVVAFFGLGNYFATTVLFSILSFVGVWCLFLTLTRRYPEIHKQLAFSVLFIPSVFFWGSGIMKDSIVLAFLGFLIYSVDRFVCKRGLSRVIPILSISLSSYIIFNVKEYVILSLIPAIIIWVVLGVRDSIQNKVVRNLVLPFLLSVSSLFIGFSIQTLGQYSDRYNVDKVFETAAGIQSWHYVEGKNTSAEHGRGSSYTLGDYDPTLTGTMVMFLPAINVTYFRPYPWEAKNVMMMISAIESSIIFIYSVFIFLGLGFFRVIKIINQDAFLLMALSFALFFGFAVGFTSYNFGALVRYKIPCIPFYLSSLFILQHKVRKMVAQSRRPYAQNRLLTKAPVVVESS